MAIAFQNFLLVFELGERAEAIEILCPLSCKKQYTVSAGKNPYYRFQIINGCLSNKRKRYWSITELINKLSEMDIRVSERAVKLDIELMRYDKRLAFIAPIKYSKANRGYYYTDEDYTINEVTLTDSQLQVLDGVVEDDLMKLKSGDGSKLTMKPD